MSVKLVIAAFVGLLALSLSALAEQPGAADDPVVAVVNGVQVHRSEIEAAARGLPEQYRQMPLTMIYGALLDRVIDSRLLAGEAERLEVAKTPEVQDQLAHARAQVLRDALIQVKVTAGITPEKLQARYEQAKKSPDFAKEEVHARHILVQNEEDAKAVIKELEGGADFAEVARRKSIGPSAETGGDLGFFRREQMVPEFAQAAFGLQPGELSKQPVQTQFGWHVIQVIDRRTVEPSFEESEPQLRQDLAREIVTALLDDLRGGAQIERFNLDGSPMLEEPKAGQGQQEGQTQQPAPAKPAAE